MECSVIIIDDHPLFSRGLAQLIETQKDFKVVGMAKDRIEALDLINKTTTDLVILDLNLGQEDGLELIKDISFTCGYHVHNIKKEIRNTNYKENCEHYLISFTLHHNTNSLWKVKEIIRKPNKDYKCWCVEEPVTHTFTLEGGIVTGNCLSIPFDKLLANGFTTRQTDVRPASSINTAFQLLAVIFQLQSLQQFGGVSATHLDWTMVPYVRKSFWKHFKDGLKYVQGLSDEDIKKFEDELSKLEESLNAEK